MIGLSSYLVLAALVFSIGLFGVMTRRNTIGILLGIELMMNAVNINLVAFSRYTGAASGMIFTVFTICITVTEAALGLAIVILLFRVRRTVMADHLDLKPWIAMWAPNILVGLGGMFLVLRMARENYLNNLSLPQKFIRLFRRDKAGRQDERVLP